MPGFSQDTARSPVGDIRRTSYSAGRVSARTLRAAQPPGCAAVPPRSERSHEQDLGTSPLGGAGCQLASPLHGGAGRLRRRNPRADRCWRRRRGQLKAAVARPPGHRHQLRTAVPARGVSTRYQHPVPARAPGAVAASLISGTAGQTWWTAARMAWSSSATTLAGGPGGRVTLGGTPVSGRGQPGGWSTGAATRRHGRPTSFPGRRTPAGASRRSRGWQPRPRAGRVRGRRPNRSG